MPAEILGVDKVNAGIGVSIESRHRHVYVQPLWCIHGMRRRPDVDKIDYREIKFPSCE